MRKSFSLLEIIFTITIISIIAIVAIPKLFYNLDTAQTIKLKADVTLIRNGINDFINKQILLNTNDTLNTLDTTNNQLFSKVLSISIISQANKSGNWSKTSSNTYLAWITNNISVSFSYNPTNFNFDCNLQDDYCEELTQ